jgi:hypothetical protein
MNCLFPAAITNTQKALCVAGGVASFSGVTAATLYGVRHFANKPAPADAKPWVGADHVLKVAEAGMVVVGGSVCTLSVAIAAVDVRNLYEAARGTTKCCDIVRKSFWTSVRVPFILWPAVAIGAAFLDR